MTKTKQNNGYSIASLVTGILSIMFGLTIFLAPIGFVLSALAIIFAGVQHKRNGWNGFATAGLVTGIIGGVFGLCFGLPMMFFWVVALTI